MRTDPDDRTESFVVEVDGDHEPLHVVVAEADGTVDRDLGFDCWLVTAPESALDAICEVEAVVRVETAATLDVGVDDDSTKSDR
jgi:hypothetical protein